MESKEGVGLPPPPGLIASLTAGFDAIANHVTAILIPVTLDLLLWFGPHLRIESIMRSFLAQWEYIARNNALPFTADAAEQSRQIAALAGKFNGFAFLRTFPVGVPSLLAFQPPSAIPAGRPIMVEFPSFLSLFGWAGILVLLGWAFGGFYFHWVARITFERKGQPPATSLGWSVTQAIVLSAIWLILGIMMSIPLMFALPAFILFNPAVAQLVYMILGILLLWLLLPVYFSPHGIFTYGQNAFASILQSLRLVRFTFPTTGIFVLASLLISQGLTFLWSAPPETSWLMLVGIGGHAFISTALLAASFIYYRDMNSWLQVMLERFKAQATSARA